MALYNRNNRKELSRKITDSDKAWHETIISEGDCWYCNGSGEIGFMETSPCKICKGKKIIKYRNAIHRKKYLCIGGPLNKQRLTIEEAKEYTFFNRGPKSIGECNHEGVLVHKDLL